MSSPDGDGSPMAGNAQPGAPPSPRYAWHPQPDLLGFCSPGQSRSALDRLGRDRVRFMALPLRVEGGDGAPARAIAILE